VDKLQYPIGRFRRPTKFGPTEREHAIAAIEEIPNRLRAAILGLSDEQLDTPYRPGGWTVRQVVHHIPDSHLNAYTRCKLALTEDNPTIRSYDEAKWAELPEAKTAAVGMSLALLDALHERWVLLLRHLRAEDWGRPLHVAHINALRHRERWLYSRAKAVLRQSGAGSLHSDRSGVSSSRRNAPFGSCRQQPHRCQIRRKRLPGARNLFLSPGVQ
jgi:hypothetical protein